MRFRMISLLAAVAMLGACETAPEDSASTGGAGQQVPAANTPPSSAPASNVASGPAEDSKEYFVVEVGDRVFFALDQYSLDADARTTLERQAAWLNKYPSVTVTVEGHCDERGTREYNLALGERRASAAKDYLVALGVDPSRVTTISYGKERPVAFGSTEDAWSQNRRGVTEIN